MNIHQNVHSTSAGGLAIKSFNITECTHELRCILSNFNHKFPFCFKLLQEAPSFFGSKLLPFWSKISPAFTEIHAFLNLVSNLPQNCFFDVSNTAVPNGRAICGVGMRQFACWDYGFESRWEQRYLLLLRIVYCQVEVSAMGRSLVQGSPTVCVCVCVCVSLSVVR